MYSSVTRSYLLHTVRSYAGGSAATGSAHSLQVSRSGCIYYCRTRINRVLDKNSTGKLIRLLWQAYLLSMNESLLVHERTTPRRAL
jgi:hypothetical protein